VNERLKAKKMFATGFYKAKKERRIFSIQPAT
jgi:hypothetical protein